MKNYKECSQEEFEAAMEKAKTGADPATFTDQDLYILRSKARADMDALFNPFREQSLYQRQLYNNARKDFEKYNNELCTRYGLGKAQDKDSYEYE